MGKIQWWKCPDFCGLALCDEPGPCRVCGKPMKRTRGD